MYNASFYPTPPKVAEKMLAKAGKLSGRSILEPSAGKGDLADAAVGKLECYYHTRCRELVHCIEIEPELQAAIRGKGYPLVGTDFLTFWPDEKYDLILMNPPFANGDAHLLHAWEILDHGDIVCLLNEQTLLSPCTANRKLLATVIEAHGEVEHLGRCFAEDAFRKTQVRVSLVHLHKKREEPSFPLRSAPMKRGLPFSATVPGSRVKWRRGTPWGTSWRSTDVAGSCSSRSRIWRRSLPTTPGRSARTAGKRSGKRSRN